MTSAIEAVEQYRARRAERNRDSFSPRHPRGDDTTDDPVLAALEREAQREADLKIIEDAKVEAEKQAQRFEANQRDAAENFPQVETAYAVKRREVEDALSILERACEGLPELRRAYEGAWSLCEKYDVPVPVRLAPMAVAESVRYVTIAVAQG